MMIRLALLLALGVTKGGPIFIKNDAPLRASTAKNAKTLKQLENGTKVIWLGPDARLKMMHKVRTKDGVEGFVMQQELSPSFPSDGGVSSSISAADFAMGDGGTGPYDGCWRRY